MLSIIARAVFVLGLVFTSMSTARAAGIPEISQIQGRVEFRERNTMVPQQMCGDVRCFSSRPYWVLLVIADSGTYELNETFNFGNDRAPEDVKISGVTVRSGSEIVLDGQIEELAPHYGRIIGVDSIRLVE
jgi:hypothetical protein